MSRGHRPIYVSQEVFEWLQRLAEPGESPDAVLRRVANLPARQQKRVDTLRPFKEDS